ncbi:Unknown protein sequence [Pseudomonas amygdali pv. lachrymans]|nr:Unknown protein sequence [Pseudomonas amygdali pv. lachrymans]
MRATESGAHVTGARQDALAATDGSWLNEVKKDPPDVSDFQLSCDALRRHAVLDALRPVLKQAALG